MDPDQEAFYFNIYQQRGGGLPIFKGARFIQYGNGFGDVLRSTTRHVVPVARKSEVPQIVENDPPLTPPIMPKRKGKKRKKKKHTLKRTTVYKAPKKRTKRKEKSANNSKLRKYNF